MAVTTIFEEQELSFAPNEDYGAFMWQVTPAAFVLSVGQEYRVKCDSEEHTCTAFDASFFASGAVGVGNLAMLGGENTGEPFLIAYFPASGDGVMYDINVWMTPSGESHKVAIYQGIEDEKTEGDTETEPDTGTDDNGEETVGVDIILYDRTGQPVTHLAVDSLTTDTPEEGVTVKFTYGELAAGTEIELDFSKGNQTVSVPKGYLVREATILKPDTLVPENIKHGEVVAGIVGTLIGDTEEVAVELSMADGDQIIEPSAGGKVLSKVTVKKPETLVPENIVKDVEIAGVIGTSEGGENYDINTPDWIDSVCFWDIDGTLIQYMSVEDAAHLAELPTPPEHDNLIFVGWNFTPEQIRTLSKPLDIGAMYDTVGGKIYITLNLTSTSYKAPSIYFIQSMANGITVDWGDGGTSVSGGTVDAVTSLSHTYSTTGEKNVVITIADGCTVTIGDGKSSNNLSGSDTQYRQVPTKIYFPSGVKIGGYALYSHSKLQELNLPPDLTELVNYALNGAGYLRKFTVIPDKVTSIGSYACTFMGGSVDTIVRAGISIPESVESIGTYAFSNSCNLRRIVFPSKITDLPNACVQNGYALKRAILPPNLLTIGNNALYDCRSLTNIELPATVNTIGTGAFSNMYSLREITIPDGVTAIPDSFCRNCYSLSKCVLHDAVESIGSNFLDYSNSLIELVVPKSVTAVGSYLMDHACGVGRLILQGDITTLGNYPISSGWVKDIIVLHDTPSSNLVTLMKKSGTYTVYVPDDAVDAYKTAMGSLYGTFVLPLSEYNGDIPE